MLSFMQNRLSFIVGVKLWQLFWIFKFSRYCSNAVEVEISITGTQTIYSSRNYDQTWSVIFLF